MDLYETYIVSTAVCSIISENSQDKAEILLSATQGLVDEAIVVLLITQGEGGRKRG